MCNPLWQSVVLGILATTAGCLVACGGFYLLRRTRNWLYLLPGVGATLFVIGVVGQHGYYATQDYQMRLACPAAPAAHPSVWDASVQIPLFGTALTPIATVGVMLALIGAVALLLFEPNRPYSGPPPAPESRFEDADSV